MLKLKYERVARERDRLRDARQFFARQLGPFPALAGGATIAGTLTDKVATWGTVASGVIFAIMVWLSYRASGRPAYRAIRSDRPGGDDEEQPIKWYRAELCLEREIYPKLGTELDAERRGLFRVQTLLVIVVAILLIAYEPSPPSQPSPRHRPRPAERALTSTSSTSGASNWTVTRQQRVGSSRNGMCSSRRLIQISG